MNALKLPQPADVSRLVEQLLNVPPERWQAALEQESVSSELRAEVLGILQARTADLAGHFPPPTDIRNAVLALPLDVNLGRYEQRQRLGTGGMGEVFKARDPNLDRIVVVKVIRPDRLTCPETRRRFLREIDAMGRVDHPNVVRALNADQVGDTVLLVMEYVEGTDLACLVKDQGPLPIALACECARQAAMGLQHLHGLGIVHRDIKPSNLMLTSPSVPAGKLEIEGERIVKIIDLGVARLPAETGTDPPSTVTGSGALMGTLDYMAPEQARQPHTADVRADLYSLGCTLFFLLTGQPPFPGGNLLEKFSRHLGEEPPLGQLRSETPASLLAVVRKLLAKHPDDRYQTAAEVAAALAQVGRELRTPSPSAPPAPRNTRLRWIAAVTLYLLLAGVAVLGWRTSPPTNPADPPRAQVPADHLDPFQIPEAERFPDWQPPELVAVLGEHRQRHWDSVYSVAISPDGRHAVSGGADRHICIWDAATMRLRHVLPSGEGVTTAVAYSPDGKWLASGCYDVTLWDVTGAAPVARATLSHGNPKTICALAFGPASTFLAVGHENNQVILWDLRTPMPTHLEPLPLDGVPLMVAFQPDGSRLLAVARGGTMHTWDVAREIPRALPTAGPGVPLHAAAVAPRGDVLAVAQQDGEVWEWNLLTDPAAARQRLWKGERNEVHSLAFSADGKTLAVAGGYALVRLVSRDDPAQELRILRGPRKVVVTLAFHPSGKSLVAGSYDGGVRLWRLADATPGPLADLPGPFGSAYSLALSPDGTVLAAAGNDSRPITRWKLGGPRPQSIGTVEAENSAWSLAWAPEGTALGIRSVKAIELWDLQRGMTWKSALELVPPRSVAFSPNGRWLAAQEKDRVRLWERNGDAFESREPLVLPKPAGYAVGLAISSDGRLAAPTADYSISLWDLETAPPTSLGPLRGHLDLVQSLVFHPDGRQLASGSRDWSVRLWDAQMPAAPPVVLSGHRHPVLALAYRPDGRLLATADRSGTILLWDPVTGRKLRLLCQLQGRIEQLAFTPEGRHLLTANGNGTVYVLRLEPADATPLMLMR